MKVGHLLKLTLVLEAVLIAAGWIAGSRAWSPDPSGGPVGAAIGFGVAYILIETIIFLYVLYGDRARLARELDEGRRDRERKRPRKK